MTKCSHTLYGSRGRNSIGFDFMTTQTVDLPTFPGKTLQRTFVVLVKVPFEEAVGLCELFGGSSATMSSIEEDDFMTEELYTTLELDAPVWLGLREENSFIPAT